MMRFTVFDRWGNQTGAIGDVIEAAHKDEVNGEDSLTLLLASCDLVKGNRIVWRDKFGTWHEHIVNDLKDVHEDGKLYTTAYCENSLSELFADYIEDLRPRNVTAYAALQRALSPTRWEIGTVDVPGTSTASFYHISAREALTKILEAWGGELSATIEVSGTGVSSRKVNITARRGADNGKRFEWTKDIQGITREVSTDDVCTALYGYGKGLEAYDDDGNPTGGYGRKLTFGDINGGSDYVADDEAKRLWGLPDGKGGIKHAFGKVVFSDCEDKGELLSLTKKELAKRCRPQVTYKANVISLADAGFAHEDVRTGDTVAIVDKELGERLAGRVLRVERYLFNEQATVIAIGNASRSIADVIGSAQSAISKLGSHAAVWDGAGSLSGGYVNAVINSLNNTINQTGGYTYYRPGEGIVTYDKPEGQNPTMAIQIKGAGFRIANSKKSNGDWNWRTFGTAAGFTADEINAGTIKGGDSRWNLETGDLHLGQGSIQSAGGSHWNLDSGELQTIFVLDPSVSTYDTATYTRHYQKVVAVEMSTATPFGIYTGYRYRYAYKDGRKDTFSTVTNKGFVGGIQLDGSNCYMRSQRVGTSETNYMTAGYTSDNYPGFEFNTSGSARFLEIADLKGDSVGFKSHDNWFLEAVQSWSGGNGGRPYVSMTPPHSKVSDAMGYPRLYMGDGDACYLYFDETHYIKVDSSGVQCRCGSKGFGWYNGSFSDSLSWI